MNTTLNARTNETLVLSGILELAVGALSGWPYALAVNNPDRIGGGEPIRSLHRCRTHGMSHPDTMFASRSVPRHLVRGALGLPMMVAAFVLVPWLGPLALLLVVPAAVLLRGCPTCWALGLAQTCALNPGASSGGSRSGR